MSRRSGSSASRAAWVAIGRRVDRVRVGGSIVAAHGGRAAARGHVQQRRGFPRRAGRHRRRRAGFSAEEAEAFLGDVPFNESVELSHWLDNGMWTSVVRFDTGVEDTPAQGPYEVVDETTVIAPGICGGQVTLGYAIEDDTVTFDVIDDDCDDLGDGFFDALNYEAVDSSASPTRVTTPR